MSVEKLFRARIVWPVSNRPIENGAVLIRDGWIAEVGPWDDLSRSAPSAPSQDLGEVALLPGLVNAHCHLDYTNMAGMIAPPARGAFGDWIKGLLALKAHWSYTEYAQSWMHGARQLLESGVTTVGDIESVPELLPEAWEGTPLRLISFFEMTGVRSGLHPELILFEALQNVRRMPSSSKNRAALSPHALYSTPPALLEMTSELLRSEGFLAAMHVAESQPEWDMYHAASGPLYDWLKTQRAMDNCGGRSPVQEVHRMGLLQPNLLVIHANYLAPGDAELLASNQCSVVHCPRSHDFFRHAPFDFEALSSAGVNICLGTDSLASTRAHESLPTLNLWDEMQEFAKTFPQVRAETILAMVTTRPAAALRLPAGALENGRVADIIGICYEGRVESLAETLVHVKPGVEHRIIAGEVI